MNKTFPIKYTLFALIINGTLLIGADKKLAQTGFQFLSVSSDARAGAMGDAMTTIFGKSSSLFFNPAGMSRQKKFLDISFSQNRWIAGINHNALSVSITPSNGKLGIFGLSFKHVDYGEIQGTMVSDNTQGFIETEKLMPSALSIGLGYAKSLSDKFSVGGHIKAASQYLGKNVVPDSDTTQSVVKNIASAFAFDFGTIYETGWRNFAFGMSVRNFSQETKFQTEGFQLPLTFTMGVSIDLMTFLMEESSKRKLILSVDALHPRSYSERMNIGMEYQWMKLIHIRSGYLLNYDEQNLITGFGIQKDIGSHLIVIDYAYTPFGVFDSVQRLSFNISLD
jgi:hypothetical protein